MNLSPRISSPAFGSQTPGMTDIVRHGAVGIGGSILAPEKRQLASGRKPLASSDICRHSQPSTDDRATRYTPNHVKTLTPAPTDDRMVPLWSTVENRRRTFEASREKEAPCLVQRNASR